MIHFIFRSTFSHHIGLPTITSAKIQRVHTKVQNYESTPRCFLSAFLFWHIGCDTQPASLMVGWELPHSILLAQLLGKILTLLIHSSLFILIKPRFYLKNILFQYTCKKRSLSDKACTYSERKLYLQILLFPYDHKSSESLNTVHFLSVTITKRQREFALTCFRLGFVKA